MYKHVYGKSKVCTWNGIELNKSTGWGLTGLTTFLTGGPDGSLGNILEQEHPGLYEKNFVHQVWAVTISLYPTNPGILRPIWRSSPGEVQL